jgi:hypothetical protein
MDAQLTRTEGSLLAGPVSTSVQLTDRQVVAATHPIEAVIARATEEVAARLSATLRGEDVAHRAADFVLEEHPRIYGHELRAVWSGARDGEGRLRARIEDGPAGGRLERIAALRPTIRVLHPQHAGEGGVALTYRFEGIDPADGHLVYRHDRHAA